MSGRMRLACGSCDRDDFDFIERLPDDWTDISEVQSYDASTQEVEFNNAGRSPFQWYTHLGTCPECQEVES